MNDLLSWTATVATIGGALLTASNLGSRITGTGFIVFLVGSLCWLGVAVMTDQPALMWTNVVLTFLNMFGIWRWLGRQAAVEEGAKAAAAASEETPGEALFPVSLLARAPVSGPSGQIGTCVDGMAGAVSGRLAYVVVTEGGMAGIGERLFKLPWQDARIDRDGLVATRDGGLEELQKDQWPAR